MYHYTEVSQVANMLLISNKISINKNKQIYFSIFSYFSLLIFYTSPRQWGLRGYLLLAKVESLQNCGANISIFFDIYGINHRKDAVYTKHLIRCQSLSLSLLDS